MTKKETILQVVQENGGAGFAATEKTVKKVQKKGLRPPKNEKYPLTNGQWI